MARQKIDSGQIQEEDFIAPTLLNGWQNYNTSGGTWEVAGYVKLPSGLVVLKGLIKNGTDGSVIFTLPAGYRPSQGSHHPAYSDNNLRGVNIQPNGDVEHRGTTTNWFSMSGIVFMAEQ